jgi:hypothetical protein
MKSWRCVVCVRGVVCAWGAVGARDSTPTPNVAACGCGPHGERSGAIVAVRSAAAPEVILEVADDLGRHKAILGQLMPGALPPVRSEWIHDNAMNDAKQMQAISTALHSV